MSANIFFSVGEPSGDQHAGHLIAEMLRRNPELGVRGFGGREMAAAGCRLDRDLTTHAVFGLLEVLPKLRDFFRFADQAEDVFRSGNIDAVVLVDFPGFNWHIAKRAKRYSIPVYYFCPPQLWAWAGWRIRKMRRTVDHVLAVLPVEDKYYSGHGVPTTYVGHPFFDSVATQRLDQQCLSRFAAQRLKGHDLVAVLPGSRSHEVHRNWPIMLESIRELHKRHPQARFLVAAYSDSQCLWCRDQLTETDRDLPIDFFVGSTSEIIEASRCAMMVSGSVSLELMARRTPAAVLYRVRPLVYAVGKCLVRVDSVTLPNLMGPRKVFPEFISVGRTRPAVEFLTGSIDAMLGDEYYFNQTLAALDELRLHHAGPGATGRAADWICRKVGAERANLRRLAA